MLYRNFAIATLLVAPIIVMAAEAFIPQTGLPQGNAAPSPTVQGFGMTASADAAQSESAEADAPATTGTFSAPTGNGFLNPPAGTSFGAPVPGAGQPMLQPGGLSAPSAPLPPVNDDYVPPPQDVGEMRDE